MVAGMGTAQGRIEVNTRPAQASLKDLNRTVQQTAQRSRTGFQKVATATKIMGAAIVAVGATAAIALGVRAVKVTSEFRSALNQAGTVAGATRKEYEAMQAAALRLGKDTSFSAGQAADAFLELARSGFSAQQSIEGVDAVVQLAAAANTDMGTSAEVASDLMTAFGLKAADLDSIVNSLAGATLNSAQSFEDLIYSTRYAAPTFSNLGFTMEDLATATAALAAEGIKGSTAGTTLRAVFARMIKPTSEVQHLMHQLGISITESNGEFKSFEDIVGIVNGSLEGLTTSQRQQAMVTLFGMRAMDGASILFRNTTDDIAALSDKVNAQGQAAKAAAATMEGLGGALKYFSGTLESTLIGAIIPFEAEIDLLIRGTADLISQWGSQFSGAATNVRDWVTAITTKYQALRDALPLGDQNTENTLFGWVQEQVAIFELWLTEWDAAATGKDLAQKLADAIGNSIANVSQWGLDLGTSLIKTVLSGIRKFSDWISGGGRDEAVDDAVGSSSLFPESALAQGDGDNTALDSSLDSLWATFRNSFKASWDANKPTLEAQWEGIKTEWANLILTAVSSIAWVVTDADPLGAITTNLNTFADSLDSQTVVSKLETWGTGVGGWFPGFYADLTLWWTGVRAAWDLNILTWKLYSPGLDTKWEAFKQSITDTWTGLGDVIGGVWTAAATWVNDNVTLPTLTAAIAAKADDTQEWWKKWLAGTPPDLDPITGEVYGEATGSIWWTNWIAGTATPILSTVTANIEAAWTTSSQWVKTWIIGTPPVVGDINAAVAADYNDTSNWLKNWVAGTPPTVDDLAASVAAAWATTAVWVKDWIAGGTVPGLPALQAKVEAAWETASTWVQDWIADTSKPTLASLSATISVGAAEGKTAAFDWLIAQSAAGSGAAAMALSITATVTGIAAWLAAGAQSVALSLTQGNTSALWDWWTGGVQTVALNLSQGTSDNLWEWWKISTRDIDLNIETSWIGDWDPVVIAGVETALEAITGFITALGEGATVYAGNLELLTPALVGLGVALAAVAISAAPVAAMGVALAGLVALVGTIKQAHGDVAAYWSGMAAGLTALGLALALFTGLSGPVVLVAVGLAALAFGAIWLVQNWDGLIESLKNTKIWTDTEAAIEGVVNWTKDAVTETGNWITKVGTDAVAATGSWITKLGELADWAIPQWIKDMLAGNDFSFTLGTEPIWWGALAWPDEPGWFSSLTWPGEPTWFANLTWPDQPTWLPGWLEWAWPDEPTWFANLTWPSEPTWFANLTWPVKPTWWGVLSWPDKPAWITNLTWPDEPGWFSTLTWPAQPTWLPGWLAWAWPSEPTWFSSLTWPDEPTWFTTFKDWDWPTLSVDFTTWEWPSLAVAFTDWSWPDITNLKAWSWPTLSVEFTGWTWPTVSTDLTGWKWPTTPKALTGWKWPTTPTALTGWAWPTTPIAFTGWGWPLTPVAFTGWAWPITPAAFTGWKWPTTPAVFTGWKWPTTPSAFTGWKWPTTPPAFTGWKWPGVPVAFTGWAWPGIPSWLRNWRWPSLDAPRWVEKLFNLKDDDDDDDRRRSRSRSVAREPSYGMGRPAPSHGYSSDPFYRQNYPGNALGTMSAPGGWSWVGERGPELMQLPRGTEVQSNPAAMQSARQTDAEPVQVTVVANEGEDSVTTWMDFRQYQFAGE